MATKWMENALLASLIVFTLTATGVMITLLVVLIFQGE